MDVETTSRRLLRAMEERYGIGPSRVRRVFAPYRICPLGAHVDHQLGTVTAMAIDRGIVLAYAPTIDREVRLCSLDYPGEVRFSLDSTEPARPGDWGNYARGAAQALAQSGRRLGCGLVGILAGPWSEGGLSSSAAVGVAYLLALEQVNGIEATAAENIRLDQAIENGYLGLRNGILDQSGILLSRRGHLTVIDCATAAHRSIPPGPAMPPWAIAIAFSGVKQALVGTDYNRRVAECAEAARVLLHAAGRRTEPALLGNVREVEYDAYKSQLSGASTRRAEHFFSEIDRVRRGVEAWKRGDLTAFGRLMTASGDSSIRNYECGSAPLIDLYEAMVACPGVCGARFSGAGFRGCCVGLIAREAAAEVVEGVGRAYGARQPALATEARVAICQSDDGARFLAAPGEGDVGG